MPLTDHILPAASSDSHSEHVVSSKNLYRPSDVPPSLPRADVCKCQRAKGLVVRNRENPSEYAQVIGPCRTRGCPHCGPVWTERHVAWVSWSIGQHERLWVAEVPRSRWRGVREKIRRADRDADYLAVEVSPGALHVVSTVCFPGASPVTTQLAVAQAVYALQHARHVIRPVMASPAWKTPDQRSKSARDRAVENAVRGIGWEVVAVVPKFRWTDLLDRLAAAGGSWRCERSEGGAELMRWIPPEGTGQREAEAFFDRVVSEALGPPVPEW